MAMLLFCLAAASAACCGHVMLLHGRLRPVLLMLAASWSACLLIWSFAPALPGIHRFALSSLAMAFFLPFGGGIAAGGLTGRLHQHLRRAA